MPARTLTRFRLLRLAGTLAVIFPVACPGFAASAAQPKLSSTGLTLQVPPFTVDGLSFPGGSIEALPQREQFVAVNLHSGALHTLPRILGDGEIVLAHVATSATAVTKLEPRRLQLPLTRIPRTLETLRNDAPLSVASFGSSLVENGAGQQGWQTLLFNPKHVVTEYYVGTRGGAKISWINHAVGGGNPRYTFALFGQAKGLPEARPTSAYDADLAIVALLPNGGEERLAVFEAVVRHLRARQREVLLLTDNAYASTGEEHASWQDGAFVRALADRYGCGVADTAAYMREAELRGEPVYTDNIHQSAAGHKKWAEAVAGALAALKCPAASPALPVAGPTVQPASAIPSGAIVDFMPKHTGGQVIPEVAGNRLGKIFGAPTGQIVFTTGTQLTLTHENMLSVDLLFDAASSFLVEVREEGSSDVIKKLSYKAPPKLASRPQTRAVVVADEGRQPAGRRYIVKITEGELRLYSVVYQLTGATAAPGHR